MRSALAEGHQDVWRMAAGATRLTHITHVPALVATPAAQANHETPRGRGGARSHLLTS